MKFISTIDEIGYIIIFTILFLKNDINKYYFTLSLLKIDIIKSDLVHFCAKNNDFSLLKFKNRVGKVLLFLRGLFLIFTPIIYK